MAKKRLSLDLDLEDYNDKKIWDYLETKRIKSKAIKNILSAYLDGADLPKIDNNRNKENKSNREFNSYSIMQSYRHRKKFYYGSIFHRKKFYMR